jgi:hypothetical protein
MAVTLNAKATSFPSFTIGKKGVTLFQGDSTPASPNAGDFWFQPTAGRIQTYTGTEWASLASESFTLITSAHTATSGERLAVDTSGGAFTITLPASPSAGDIVEFVDNGNFASNNLTIDRNGSNIDGTADDLVVSDNNTHFWLQYKDGTTGWEVFGVVGVVTSGGDSSTTSTTSYSGGGTLALGPVILLTDSLTYTLPSADSVSNGESMLIELPSTYSSSTPTVQRAGTDLIRYSGGTDTSYQYTNGAQSVRFISNGTDEWMI